MNYHIIKLITLTVLLTSFSQSQEKPAGKFSGYMFGDYFYNIQRDTAITSLPSVATGGAKDLQGFQFRRIYFTYDNTISNSFNSRFRLEMNDKMALLVKDAYLRWKNIFDGSDMIFGVQPTPAFEISETAWSYRSLEKTIMDLRGIVNSRDLAISLKGKLDNDGIYNYWIMIGNNSGTNFETDKYKRYYANFHVKPNDNFQISVYGDLKAQSSINNPNNITLPQTSLNNNVITGAVFIGYSEKNLYSFGLEGFTQMTQNGIKEGSAVPFSIKDKNAIGVSAFASYYLKPELTLIGRYDFYDPNMNNNFKGDSRNYIIAGMSWNVDNNVSIMPNVQIEMYEKTMIRDITSSITGRITLYYIFL